ncbi:hypothetical protein MNBD_GAMMA23-553 [hydrothermal vent metagenome]|uniref:DsrS n=1 Tax=hydrothermal vent metagenome TaxID=652676 RepID=A0A3B1A914_9ZZZZ
MELSAEDSLRMNVLLTQQLQAIRIDESKMIVYGLSDRGEAKVVLNPNCRDEQYIKQVKEFISTQVLGSPGGYPIYLRRWTRMGQAKHDSLERLLQLGEAEAVIAVVHAESLTDELARRAWWVMQTSANARCMLERDLVANGEMGEILAEFLVEFLPFEEQPKAMLDSIRLVLKPNLISEDTKQSLWKKGQRKNAFLAGFMRALPDHLPLQAAGHPAYADYTSKLAGMNQNPFAAQLLRCLSPQGQAFFKTALTVLKKPGNQDVAIELLVAIANYFSTIKPVDFVPSNVFETLPAKAHDYIADGKCGYTKAINEIIVALPDAQDLLKSMLVLAQLDIHLVNPIFARSDAMGTVMRKKLAPIFDPITDYVTKLIT